MKQFKVGDIANTPSEVANCQGIWDEINKTTGKVETQRKVIAGKVIEMPTENDVTEDWYELEENIYKDFMWKLVEKF